MKTFIVISTIVAIATAQPAGLLLSALPTFRTSLVAAAPIQSQFHAQDILGQYSYGYNNGLSSKGEVKSFDGVTRGSYSYVDAEGHLQTVDYTADDLNGFRVAATNLPRALPAPEQELPEPIVDTPEVAQAKAAHLAAVEEASRRASASEAEQQEQQQQQQMENLDILPKPVEDTPEVAQARAEHLEAKRQAELRNAIAGANEIHFTTGPAILNTAGISRISTVPLISTLRASAGIPAAAVLHHSTLPLTFNINNHGLDSRILPTASYII